LACALGRLRLGDGVEHAFDEGGVAVLDHLGDAAIGHACSTRSLSPNSSLDRE
jgi:hypothetical protein